MIVLNNDVLIYLYLPILSIFIRLSLDKLGVVDIWLKSKYSVLNNLGFCALCYFTWSNIISSCLYSIYTGDYFFILSFPILTVINLMLYFKYFDNE